MADMLVMMTAQTGAGRGPWTDVSGYRATKSLVIDTLPTGDTVEVHVLNDAVKPGAVDGVVVKTVTGGAAPQVVTTEVSLQCGWMMVKKTATAGGGATNARLSVARDGSS